ncbi:efflux RND transporter periplasmic adaptor subunit [Stutzerimonas tarimensis]|uniref:Efflux RND transporter periplasmic adaptor subunit n=1 Tax=Stutzerimonas tarimensis TaxID=1507735 RepID=A0ABV7T3V9_9GAMM
MPSSILRPVRRYGFGIGFVLLLSAAGYFYFLRGETEAGNGAPALSVTRGDIQDAITALGTLQPLDYVDVGVQVSGQLQRLHVQLGDQVEEGQLLAEIDPEVFQAKVVASEAQLKNQRAQLKERQAQHRLAELQLKRQRALQKEDATSQEAVETAEAQLEVTAAQIEALEAQLAQTMASLEENRANLRYTKVYAPMSGTVVSQSAQQGQTLNANQQAPVIVQIANLAQMTVKTQVSEADINRLRVGMPVYFTTLGSERRWEANLRQILPTPEVINNVVLYNAQFDVANPEGRLMTQMSAQVFFLSAQADDVLVVPMSVLQGRRGRPQGEGQLYRLQVLENGRPVEREVLIGLRDRVHAQVLDGLREGERLLAPTNLANAAGGANTGAQRRMGPPGPRI